MTEMTQESRFTWYGHVIRLEDERKKAWVEPDMERSQEVSMRVDRLGTVFGFRVNVLTSRI